MGSVCLKFGISTGRAAVLALVAFAAIGAGLEPAAAQELAQNTGAKPAKDADPVVARVDGTAIRQSDVETAIEQLPPQYTQIPRETLVRAMTEKLIDGTLAANRARAAGMHKENEFRVARNRAELQLLEQIYIKRLVERKVTDRAVRRRYDRDSKSMTRGRQVRARHILVKTRQEAINAIAMLDRGKDFAALAQEISIGPSKSQGGDLGFFKREQMVPAFSKAAFAMKKGEFSKAPVQTRFGWHVIKVEEVKSAAPPSFAEVHQQLRQKMSDEVIEKEMQDLRKAAKIERLLPSSPPPK